jgi:hypothetical protein
MHQSMRDLIVSTNKDGTISIQQSTDDRGHNDDPTVIVTSEQVVILIEWLTQAKAEIDGAG